jgi:hypothetical protein
VLRNHRVVALLLLTWVPLVILAAAGGVAVGNRVSIPLLFDYVVDARFLVALPVLIGAEGVIWGRVIALSQYLVRSGLIVQSEAPALEQLVRRFDQLRRSKAIPVLAAMGVVFGGIFYRKEFTGDASTWQFVAGPAGPVRSAAGWWYLLVSVPVFQFFILCWAWRYVAWCWFLFRLSRLDFVLLPSHPDRSAGLRPIGQAHQYWAIIVFALSSLLSADIGLELVKAGRSLADFRIELISFLALSLLALFAPLLAFSGKLLAARTRGLLEYGALAAEYTHAFDAKWIGRPAAASDLLGSSDIQSLADLGNSYQIVLGLRMVPFELLNVFVIVLLVAVPFFPLVFAEISPIDVVKHIVQILL